MKTSTLASARSQVPPPMPQALQKLKGLTFGKGKRSQPANDTAKIGKLFPKTVGQPLLSLQEVTEVDCSPLKVGVVFSGGQAAGGHNVILGLFEAIQMLNSKSELFGFLDGPSGIVDGKYEKIEKERALSYRNRGGFDMIGSGRTKIETEEQFKKSLQTVEKLKLDGLVVIGGDDSNTNAALLAEYFLTHGCKTKVIGVPKTIDGDLQNEHVPISFGFDTACKTYSELIGNIGRDALSAKKYTHFIKLMGRSASHIALECALATQPNMTLIGEEIASKKKTLATVVSEMADLIEKRAKAGKHYGIILLPEGVVEFIPDVGALIGELNKESDVNQLSKEAKKTYDLLPKEIQEQLQLDRDPHGNVQLSHIESEKLFIQMVKAELKKRGDIKFSPVAHFFGYEGRSSLPTNFDANYCYALGLAAALLIKDGHTGYMAFVPNLFEPVDAWTVGGLPHTQLMHMEVRKGKEKPVIAKALVDLKGKAFKAFEKRRGEWEMDDRYLCPGPIQFFGPPELTDTIPKILL